MSPALFLLPIALAISGLLWFRMKCEFSISEKKNADGSLIEIAMNLWIILGELCTF